MATGMAALITLIVGVVYCVAKKGFDTPVAAIFTLFGFLLAKSTVPAILHAAGQLGGTFISALSSLM